MKIEIDTVKGFQDFLPPESLKREAIREIIRKQCRLYGFLPIETPVIEFDELMRQDTVNGVEDEAVSDRFRLEDRAGRHLGLRYEFTFQLARIMKQNPNMKLPFRRYQIGEVFRDEPIGPGRLRQFTQCDADIVGDSSVDAEVECLALVSDIMKELKINAEVHVNNRQLLKSLIESVEIQAVYPVMRELDKIDKLGEDEVKANLKKYADSNQVLTLFKLLEKDIDFYVKNAFDGASDLAELIEKAKKSGVNAVLRPFMIRGLGYYTGNIFEVKIKDNQNTLAAGGRYDKLVGKYLDREIPSVGISFGLDRLSEIANIKTAGTSLMIISVNQDNEAAKLLKRLRKSGISCIMAAEKIGKALEYANALSIPYVLFVGSDEIEKERFKLRDMRSGKEADYTERQIVKKFVG